MMGGVKVYSGRGAGVWWEVQVCDGRGAGVWWEVQVCDGRGEGVQWEDASACCCVGSCVCARSIGTCVSDVQGLVCGLVYAYVCMSVM